MRYLFEFSEHSGGIRSRGKCTRTILISDLVKNILSKKRDRERERETGGEGFRFDHPSAVYLFAHFSWKEESSGPRTSEDVIVVPRKTTMTATWHGTGPKAFEFPRVYTWDRQSCWLSWLYPWPVCSPWSTRNNYISFDGRFLRIRAARGSSTLPDSLPILWINRRDTGLAGSGPQIRRRDCLQGSNRFVCFLPFSVFRFPFNRPTTNAIDAIGLTFPNVSTMEKEKRPSPIILKDHASSSSKNTRPPKCPSIPHPPIVPFHSLPPLSPRISSLSSNQGQHSSLITRLTHSLILPIYGEPPPEQESYRYLRPRVGVHKPDPLSLSLSLPFRILSHRHVVSREDSRVLR